MPLSEQQQQELVGLITSLYEQSLSAAELARLEELLASDEAARKLYARYTVMRGLLQWQGSERPAAARELTQHAGHEHGNPSRANKPSRFWAQPKPLSLVVATIVIGLLVTAMYYMVPPFYRAMTRGPHVAFHSYEVVAQVTAVDAPVWAGQQASPFTGAHLVAERTLELRTGLAEVTFRGGAIVVLQGPCKFTVHTPASGSLDSGHLVARVSDEAKGFRVRTPTAEVIDLGTEFGISADDEETHIVVLEGNVEVQAGAAVQQFAAGEGVRLTGAPGQLMWRRGWNESLAENLSAASRKLTHRIISTSEWKAAGTMTCSATDLADRHGATLAKVELIAGEAGYQSDAAKLFDGDMYGGEPIGHTNQSLTPLHGAVVEVTFDSKANRAGYDIQAISSFTGSGQSRGAQHYTVEARPVGGKFEPLFQVGQSLSNNTNLHAAGEVKIVTNRAGAPLATGIEALRFTFHNVTWSGLPETMYREIDVFGTPTVLATDQ